MTKIMVLHPEGSLDTNVNLAGLLTIFCEQGWQVHYYGPGVPGVSPVAPHPGVTIVPVADNHVSLIDTYDLIIGIDRDGIIFAASIARHFRVPCGFISYEIDFAAESGAAFKQPEIDACAGISFAVCQGVPRSAELARENHLDPAQIIDIPVAGRGVVRGPRETHLHEALGLPTDLKLALYMGSLAPEWAMVDELIASTREWDDSWMLVLHSRHAMPELVRETQRRHAGASRFRFTPRSGLPWDGLDSLLKSADLGVALYRPHLGNVQGHAGRNLRHLGLSSGKISSYLQHGVPVVVNDIGEISAAVDAERPGDPRAFPGGTGAPAPQHRPCRAGVLARGLLSLFRTPPGPEYAGAAAAGGNQGLHVLNSWARRDSATGEVVLHDAPDGADPVPPADLLALLVGSPVVGNAHLKDPAAELRHLGRDFRFEAEPVLLDRDALDDLAAKDLVAGLHVGEVQVREHVRQQRQQAVAHAVPEVQHPVGLAAHEAGAEDHVGPAITDRRREARVLDGIVFEVRVLDQHDVTRGHRDPAAQGRALAPVDGMADQPVDERRQLALQQPHGAVAGAVINDDYLGHTIGRRTHQASSSPMVAASL